MLSPGINIVFGRVIVVRLCAYSLKCVLGRASQQGFIHMQLTVDERSATFGYNYKYCYYYLMCLFIFNAEFPYFKLFHILMCYFTVTERCEPESWCFQPADTGHKSDFYFFIKFFLISSYFMFLLCWCCHFIMYRLHKNGSTPF